MASGRSLPSLLAKVLREIEQFMISKGAGSKQLPSLDLWSNLVRVVGESGTDRSHLPNLTRLSKRALRSRISAAERQGWVQLQKCDPGLDRLFLTARGKIAEGGWKELHTIAGKWWQSKIGLARANKLRSLLESSVAMLPLEHPHYPASYGAADATITGNDGQDWKAVPRENRDTVAGLPLTALVSQLLVAFAMDYEKMSPVALSLSAAIVCRIPPEGCWLRELRNPIGASALIRHGFLQSSGARGKQHVILTSKGLNVKSAYNRRVMLVEAAWNHKFGEDLFMGLRGILTDVSDLNQNIPPSDHLPG